MAAGHDDEIMPGVAGEGVRCRDGQVGGQVDGRVDGRAGALADVRVPTTDLRADLGFFSAGLGMRLEMIYPADDPRVALFEGFGLRLRLEQGASGGPARLRVLCDEPARFADGRRLLTAPGGAQVEIAPRHPAPVVPRTEHAFVVRRLADRAPWVIGRAGMHYRDLVPSRLGGAMIASHIRIPDGGPVPDMVHFHRVGFQLIFCISGWVDVVYEDQGGPRRLHAGDCFIQPPEIRHRVLAASDGIEVIEIGVPAEHVTEIDHEMELPTPDLRPEREWQGQRFVHNVAARAEWAPFRIPGFVARDTTIAAHTGGVAGVQVARPDPAAGTPPWTSHHGDILFGYVLSGGFTLEAEGRAPSSLAAGDAFVIPPGLATRYGDCAPELELLEVALPGEFPTRIAAPR